MALDKIKAKAIHEALQAAVWCCTIMHKDASRIWDAEYFANWIRKAVRS